MALDKDLSAASVSAALRAGSKSDVLRAMARRLAVIIDNPETHPRDSQAAVGRMMSIVETLAFDVDDESGGAESDGDGTQGQDEAWRPGRSG